MITLDTNVVVRLLIHDDPDQTRRARRLVETKPVLILPTVLLEAEWVLRGAYGVDRAGITQGFQKLLGLPGLKAENGDAIAQALRWYEGGLDFADALHLALSREASGFATFDTRLARRAARLGAGKVVTL